MANFSRPRRAMATADLIDRLNARIAMTESMSAEETTALLQETIARLGEYEDEVQRHIRSVDTATGFSRACLTIATQVEGTPDFKRAAAALFPFSTAYDRMWMIVRAFEKAVDEAGLYKGESGKVLMRLIWKYVRHDLAGELGMSLRYQHRNAVAALKGLDPVEKDPA